MNSDKTGRGNGVHTRFKSIQVNALHKLFFGSAQVSPKKEWAAELQALGLCEELKLERNGIPISVLKIRPKETHAAANRAVLFCHPLKKRAKAFFADGLRISEYLKEGVTVFLFDFNGFGNSPRNDLFFWKDVAEVMKLIRLEFRNAPLIIHGVSFGAFHLIRATSHLPKGSTVVLENVSRSLEDYWKKSKATLYAIKALKVLNPEFIRDMDVLSYLKSVAPSDSRFVLIACENDNETPAADMMTYLSLLGEKACVHLFNNADHLEAPSKDSNKYSKIIEGILLQTWGNKL